MSSTEFSRRDIATILAAGVGLGIGTKCFAAQAIPAQASLAGPALRTRAAKKGLLVGAAVLARTLGQDSGLAAALKTEANVLVPEIELKWDQLQPSGPDQYQFGPAEQIYAFAAANGMKMRGHTLTWYRAQPRWAIKAVPDMSPGDAEALLRKYVGDVVGHWRGRICQWDVANEAIDGRQQLTEPLFSAKLGERYLDIAYHVAHEADPAAQLVFNTDLIEMDDPYEERHRTATLVLLERLLSRGVPVHALGIEGHLTTMKRFSEPVFRKFLDEVTGMGLKLMVTEFDVNDQGTIGMPDKRDADAAALGGAFLDVVLGYRECQGVLTWALSDRYSWLRTAHDRQRSDNQLLRPSPLDDHFRRKPLWQAMATAIDAAPPR